MNNQSLYTKKEFMVHNIHTFLGPLALPIFYFVFGFTYCQNHIFTFPGSHPRRQFVYGISFLMWVLSTFSLISFIFFNEKKIMIYDEVLYIYAGQIMRNAVSKRLMINDNPVVELIYT